MNYIHVPDNNPVVIELDFTKNPIKTLNCIGMYFGMKISVNILIMIEYALSATGKSDHRGRCSLNVGNTVISNMKANQLYKVRITLSGYSQDHKRFRINRYFCKVFYGKWKCLVSDNWRKNVWRY